VLASRARTAAPARNRRAEERGRFGRNAGTEKGWKREEPTNGR
jgi:hypothetical protein